MNFSSLKKLLTNNYRFRPDHPDYRRVCLLNTMLFFFILIAAVFAVLNAIHNNYLLTYIEAAAAALCLATVLFFHISNNIEICSYAVIVIMLGVLIVLFAVSGHMHYMFVWACVYPPVVFFLLGKKKGFTVSLLVLAYLTFFMAMNSERWRPADFTLSSMTNILAALLTLILLISYFELTRHEAATAALQKNSALEKAIRELGASREQLRLILDSTAEAIFGVDMETRCTFCNTNSVEMLGLKSEDELLGKDIHELIHYKHKDGTPLLKTECNIVRTCMEGVATHADDEVFWRPNGTSFEVEYNSYPQYKDGELVGAVVTFVDNTLKKMREQQIEYFSSHDSLTGLLNRSYFETVLHKLDNRNNLPISVIMGDLNGLKLTNDIFGHGAGDELLIKIAEILKKVCRSEDLICRYGGDEFTILLPRTQNQDAQMIISRIRDVLSKERVSAIRCSMSLGCNTKTESNQSLSTVMKSAENQMYQEKAMSRNKVNADMINALIMSLYGKSQREERHSANVSELCKAIGEALGLPDTEVAQLRSAGFLHDIGKIGIDDAVIDMKEEAMTEEEASEYRQHPVIGFRILNLFDNTLNLAESVYSHHEYWDGRGYPRGLKGNEIPLNARIITVAGWYDTLMNDTLGKTMTREEAVSELQKEAGTRLDPHIVNVFAAMLKEKQL